MYSDEYSEEIAKKLAKLAKKEPKHYSILRKKMDWILDNPNYRFKYLHYDMSGMQRVHIGHFVLVFRIDNIRQVIFFEDYEHHDKIYE